MAVLGYAQLANNGLPTNWDKDEMSKVALADGRSFTDVLEEADAAVQEMSQAVIDDPRWGGMIAVQDSGEIEYHIGSTGGVKKMTEQGVPDPRRGQTAAHQIGLSDYGDALGWTLFGLRDRRTPQLEADIMTATKSVESHLQWLFLTRFFTMESVTVGGAGKSVPFADGGVADSTYIPPTSPEGTAFLSTHDHFIRQAALNDANVNAVIDHLWEHGLPGTYDIVASAVDAASWVALTGFRKPSWNDLNHQQSAEVRAVAVDNNLYIGSFEGEKGVARIWVSGRLPTNYWGIYKSFGQLEANNPLRMRIRSASEFGFKVVPGAWVNTPSQLAVFHAQHEAGVGQNRTNGVCVFVAGSGDYITPTISNS